MNEPTDNTEQPGVLRLVQPATAEGAALVALLERWLERAKSGELLAVGVCGAMRGHVSATEFEAADRWAELVAASSELTHRLHHLT